MSRPGLSPAAAATVIRVPSVPAAVARAALARAIGALEIAATTTYAPPLARVADLLSALVGEERDHGGAGGIRMRLRAAVCTDARCG